jgi:hypothetical protein
MPSEAQPWQPCTRPGTRCFSLHMSNQSDKDHCTKQLDSGGLTNCGFQLPIYLQNPWSIASLCTPQIDTELRPWRRSSSTCLHSAPAYWNIQHVHFACWSDWLKVTYV